MFPLRKGSCWLVLLHLSAGPALASPLPDSALSTATIDYAGPEPLSVMVAPDGTGDPLTAAFLPDGSRVSAGITVTLIDAAGWPVAHYPNEDIWLEAVDGGLAFCIGGNWAMSDTDANGQTRIEAAPRGGGASEAGLRVYISGAPLLQPALPIRANSPDLNGDQIVDLVDVVLFTGDFYRGYGSRSDFSCDGAINLSDISRLARAFAAQCP